MQNETPFRGPARPWWVRVLSVAVLAFSMGSIGCSDLERTFEDTRRTRTALKTELGVDSNIGFRWTNGRTVVSVRLESLPAGEATEVKRKVADVVTRTFRSKVERVDVSF